MPFSMVVHIPMTDKQECISLFSAAITKYLRLNNFKRIEVYLTHRSGGWEIQENVIAIGLPAL